ncbi:MULTISPECIES: flavocytochrome c [unclassified Oceanispirochaeta]|uniref:flavocytochrome c n=1 Tax=unclassified Oceanispirochaeta TaxID=2635722 RepID=UPI000E09DA5B|nr:MULTISPECIES: flavocytochrome c [unclassified Oceanispirochaeta]MBF9016016.1 flavocytochrome c [Oceanispirochaeta sp. M2]NPD72479.1 flavocytochrome c [Oceanispirochaeta sp. M1]RDG31938.1 flavocytochrome c [Oceanispirochaeta sp. M1]
MKSFIRLMSVLLTASLLLISCGGKDLYTAGTYTGEGQGHGGTIVVSVTVDSKAIQSIEVVENPESEFSLKPIQTLIERAVKANSGDIDAVSGASETSAGMLAAINGALAKAATGNTAAISDNKDAKSTAKDETTDIVIIGAGGAGLSAAKIAGDAGARVIVLEKMPFVGGNTNYATGGLNAAETEQQAALGIEDSVEQFYEDTMKGGKNLNNPELVKVLTQNSADTVKWLISLGADLTDVGRLGGATNNRTHRPTGGAGVGAHIVSVLDKVAEEVSDIRTNSKVVAITSDANGVTGVDVESEDGNYHITAKAVIVATGGFGASQEKVVRFKPELKGFGTTNHPGATGDAFDLVRPLNVALVDIEQIQTHPTVVPVKNKMITEAVRGNGAILVNRDAVRFISELQTRDVVSAAELEQTGKTAFLFFDQGVRESLSAIEKYAKAGYLTEAASIAELAGKMELNAAALEATVNQYNSYVDGGSDPDFDRSDLPRKLETGPYYMVEVGPAVHHTMGGLKIDTETRVYTEDGEWVSGLFAAGEVTGGVHGANRLGGNAMADITTYGQIAGAQAAAYIK